MVFLVNFEVRGAAAENSNLQAAIKPGPSRASCPNQLWRLQFDILKKTSCSGVACRKTSTVGIKSLRSSLKFTRYPQAWMGDVMHRIWIDGTYFKFSNYFIEIERIKDFNYM
ncbi:hypothetical protein GOP47_0003104 [Adiantum capillus-veneris]|uniref:Uncharacterized protein n=1 Tax=Adiantum capillus-veneris TaxID=13818 RepID=A0A9D4VCW7_ADICA|nr:hypothetical protein GOP47_0003104 [Adiantum capillus-veneris]